MTFALMKFTTVVEGERERQRVKQSVRQRGRQRETEGENSTIAFTGGMRNQTLT